MVPAMRLAASVLGVALVWSGGSGCAGPFGSAPLVLTELPNRPSGEALLELGAARSGCSVARAHESLRIDCPEGALEVPTFTGPPTFAVRCVDERLRDAARCTALVRKVLLSTEDNRPSPAT
jgi:hypothetical protein